jgi:hypothetical protein
MVFSARARGNATLGRRLNPRATHRSEAAVLAASESSVAARVAML